MFSGFLPIPDLERPQNAWAAIWSSALGRYLPQALTGAVLSGFAAGQLAIGSTTGGLSQDSGLSFSAGVLNVVGVSGAVTITTPTSNGIIMLRTDAYGSSGGPSISFRADDGTNPMTSGNSLGGFAWLGRRTSSATTTSAKVSATATENWSNTAVGTKLTLEVTPNGSTTRVVAVTIDQDSSISIAGTAVSSSTTTGALIVSGGVGIAGAVNVAGAIKGASAALTTADAGTTNQPSIFTLNHTTSGTPAAGFGCDFDLNAHSSTNALRSQASILSRWTDATDATRKARVEFYAVDTGFREFMRGEAGGSAPMIGFLGANASARISFAAWTGTATRTAIATGSATATQCAEAIKALVDDLRTFGLYG